MRVEDEIKGELVRENHHEIRLDSSFDLEIDSLRWTPRHQIRSRRFERESELVLTPLGIQKFCKTPNSTYRTRKGVQ